MILTRALVIAVVVISLTDAIVLRNNKIKKNNDQCQELRCIDATNMARRLAKLSLLPDFVTETLKLLENLMQEMENELQNSASHLLEQVEPSCASLREEMNPILKKKKKRSGRQREDLGMDIEPHVSEDSLWQEKFSNSTEDMYYSQKERKLTGDDFRHPSSRKDTDWPAVDNDDDRWSSDRSDRHGSHSISSQHKWSQEKDNKHNSNSYANKRMWSAEDYEPQRANNYGNKWSEETNKPKRKWDEPTEEKKWPQIPAYVQSSSNRHPSIEKSYPDFESKGQSEESEYSEFGWTEESRHSQSRNKHGRKESNPGKKYILNTDKSQNRHITCRGIDNGSPYWVPGLDQWCVTNCAAGYCPETHCVC